MLAYMGSHWHEYALRSQQVSILNDIHAKGWGELWISFSKHLLMVNFRGDHHSVTGITSAFGRSWTS